MHIDVAGRRFIMMRVLQRASWVIACGLVLGLCLFILSHAAPNVDALLAMYAQRWGSATVPRISAWRELMTVQAGAGDLDRLKRVNEFFNRNITFSDDQAIWGQLDYWATPLESLGRGTGDCEDFSIAKYFTLQTMGMSADKLRLIYVHARTGTAANTQAQAHMVLAYYARPDAEPLVLDNLVDGVRPASRRPDLIPVFSFNSQGIFAGASGKELAPAVGSGRLSRWEDLLKRAHAEGFE